ncbi:MAG: hypothetical protein Q7S58_17440 [Candidatus Binatus sp.]|uniref:hypothetical protein n=1 Tax=Candidatus Binatus sp. TaxID=2811406 RepID=UPI002724F755|nr:hypothetical protein [Candidatus Binatus sp.]MDO8434186.1 hypothetical protein [Candidatus Binatus sp.]
MWLRVSIDHQPVMINGDRILKIVGLPKEEGRGCMLFVSQTEFITVDQSLQEVMISLGFEDRG